eukprot:Sspe_Gene.11379::Locus_3839_Transcript_1_1_Confidence_1.000_Length_2162::g.11379::m.11379
MDSARSTGMASSRSRRSSTMITYSEAVVPTGQFGDKTIGAISGFMLLVNNVTGPGLATMCNVNTSSGYGVTALILLLCLFSSALACTMLLESIKRIPGNSRFDQRIEFTTLAKVYFTGKWKWLYALTLAFFLFSFLTTLVTSVIESAQTMDSALIELFHKSCGLQLWSNKDADVGAGKFGFVCVGDGASTSDSPFGDSYIISIGYLVVLVLAVPLGYWNLDDNVWVQNGAFVGLCFIVFEWCMQAFVHGLNFNKEHGKVPFIGSDQSQVFGTVLFNYAFVTTVPSWCNERKVGVNINRSIWGSVCLGSLMFFSVGLFGAAAWDFSGDSDLLTVLTSSSTPGVSRLTRILAYLFPIVALVTSIPIFSIIVRYNLLENNLCGPFWANFWGALFPWVAAIALYTGNLLGDTVNWSGILTIIPLNFMLPAWFYIRSLEGPANEGDDWLLNDDANDAALLKDAEEGCAEWAVGDEVDGWSPGCNWVPGKIKEKNEDGTYNVEWVEGDVVGKSFTPSVEPSNIRPRTEERGATTQAHREESDKAVVNPREEVIRRHIKKLQAKLDLKEQKIEKLREEINAFIVQYPNRDEQPTIKELHQVEMRRLQRQVDRIIAEMEQAREGTWNLPPAARDELFSALPATWSVKTKRTIAYGLIVFTGVMNIIALAFQIA